jgi:thiol-disulfide isomerase/thioredoxin
MYKSILFSRGMKGLLLVFILSVVQACATTKETPEYALGVVSSDTLLANYVEFAKGYQQFVLTDEQQKSIQQWPNNLSVITYFGTWCHDSQREVPRMLKILQMRQEISHRLIGLDYQKHDPDNMAGIDGIQHTPTFIIKVGDKEIGRIIERPKINLVSDIDEMLNQ